jgi:4-diphosphocytidyl-2-C-methyl-D-erythritol kinase
VSGSLSLDAPAKLNLYLHVRGRRADGYHRLDSLVAFLDIADTLTAAPGEGLSLAVSGPTAAGLGAIDPDHNIVLEAARALALAAGRPARAALRLDKRLPVAAGLGGGSADAAAALRLLDRLWGTRAGEEDLRQLGLRLGADVPACLAGVTARMRGVGEILEETGPLPEADLVLVNPRRPLATAEVFRRYRPVERVASRRLGAVKDADQLARLIARRRNDLTRAAASLEPAIPVMLAALNSTGALIARMTGSGATCFGLYASRDAAARARAWLAGTWPEWWVAATAIRSLRPATRHVASVQH